MLALIFALTGGLYGWRKAVKRGGDRMDKLQYAAVYLLIFTIIGLFVGVLADRFIFT